jgi:hypothetical protein
MKYLYALLGCVACLSSNIHATPSSVFFTNCTTNIQDANTVNFGVYNFFSVYSGRGHNNFFAPDIGLEAGVCKFGPFAAEVGIDYIGGTDDPLFFNAKVGINENTLFAHAPAFNIGIFNVGTRTHGSGKTNQNIVDAIVGKTLPDSLGGGNVYAGVFSGSKTMGKDRQGVMVAFVQNFYAARDTDGKLYHKWQLAADYASGKNTIGGGGIGIGYYFTPRISLLTGPCWYNDKKLNHGRFKWSVQLDIEI